MGESWHRLLTGPIDTELTRTFVDNAIAYLNAVWALISVDKLMLNVVGMEEITHTLPVLIVGWGVGRYDGAPVAV